MLLSVSCIQMQQIGLKMSLNCLLLYRDNVCQTLLLDIIVRIYCVWWWMAEQCIHLELAGKETEGVVQLAGGYCAPFAYVHLCVWSRDEILSDFV